MGRRNVKFSSNGKAVLYWERKDNRVGTDPLLHASGPCVHQSGRSDSVGAVEWVRRPAKRRKWKLTQEFSTRHRTGESVSGSMCTPVIIIALPKGGQL